MVQFWAEVLWYSLASLRTAPALGENENIAGRWPCDTRPIRPRGDADALLAARSRLLQRIEASAPARLEAVKTRYHGDFHLAQVLVHENDFVIIYFEGEPRRTIAERRHKDSPLRDVAGMLRSFDYARHTALQKTGAQQAKAYAQLEPFAAAWKKRTGEAFLRAYFEALQWDMLLRSTEGVAGLTALFELEKALYELRYELGNRLDWVYIPLRGLLALTGEEAPWNVRSM